MGYIKFINSDNFIPAIVRPRKHIVNIKTETPVTDDEVTGFHFYLFPEETDTPPGRYDTFVTLYKRINETEFELSNNGEIYVPPEPIPEPEPYVPTLEEVRETKVQEMNALQQAAIQSGVNVTLTDGTVEHFTLTEHDQTSLVGLQSQVADGEDNIPWHTSEEGEHCKFYSNADMGLIITQAMAWVTWHVTYFRDLRIYIRSLSTKEEVSAVTYGVALPEEYQSDPLKVMIAAQTGE